MSRTEDHVIQLKRQLAQSRESFQQSAHPGLTNGRREEEEEDGEDLRATVGRLKKEVSDLQASMQQVLDWILYAQPVPRPRTLQLPNKSAPFSTVQQRPVESFAQGMASRLIQQSVSAGDQQQQESAGQN